MPRRRAVAIGPQDRPPSSCESAVSLLRCTSRRRSAHLDVLARGGGRGDRADRAHLAERVGETEARGVLARDRARKIVELSSRTGSRAGCRDARGARPCARGRCLSRCCATDRSPRRTPSEPIASSSLRSGRSSAQSKSARTSPSCASAAVNRRSTPAGVASCWAVTLTGSPASMRARAHAEHPTSIRPPPAGSSSRRVSRRVVEHEAERGAHEAQVRRSPRSRRAWPASEPAGGGAT